MENVERLLQEVTEQSVEPEPIPKEEPLAEEPTWRALAECQIKLPLVGLLKLVPRFTETIMTVL